jgi:hypothetical protein
VDDANYFVYKEKDFPSILGDIHSRLVSKIGGNSVRVHEADGNRCKTIQYFLSILNDIHLQLTPKTLPENGRSSNTCGEEDGKYMWISTSTVGTVMGNM